MNIKEFSNEFDVILDSYKVKNQFGETENFYSIQLDEYEKSVYLTNAQKELVLELYSGRNLIGNYSYEEKEEIRRYLSTLNKTIELNKVISTLIPISDNPSFYKLPKNTLVITLEQVKIDELDECFDGKYIGVKPLKRDNYLIFKDNPFRQPNYKFAYRIDHEDNYIEIIYNKNLSTYKVSILISPPPIILEDLNYLSIDGISTLSECILPEILHKEILIRAVKLCYINAPQLNNNN